MPRAKLTNLVFCAFVDRNVVSTDKLPDQLHVSNHVGHFFLDQDKICFGTQSKKARTKSAKDAT